MRCEWAAPIYGFVGSKLERISGHEHRIRAKTILNMREDDMSNLLMLG